jgi:AcrR family transcriptional regulator
VRVKKTADRRVQRTRRQLHDALLDRILEKRYDAITVQEILDRAEVGRSTFYTHFRDKNELLTSGFPLLKASLDSVVDEARTPAGRSYERIVAHSTAMFEHAASYREIHRALRGSRAEALVNRNLRAVSSAVIGRRVELEMQRHGTSETGVSAELLTLFLVSTQIALLTWWLDARNPVPVEEVDNAYRRLVLPVLGSIFERP